LKSLLIEEVESRMNFELAFIFQTRALLYPLPIDAVGGRAFHQKRSVRRLMEVPPKKSRHSQRIESTFGSFAKNHDFWTSSCPAPLEGMSRVRRSCTNPSANYVYCTCNQFAAFPVLLLSLAQWLVVFGSVRVVSLELLGSDF
jgi:hypothetical protein